MSAPYPPCLAASTPQLIESDENQRVYLRLMHEDWPDSIGPQRTEVNRIKVNENHANECDLNMKGIFLSLPFSARFAAVIYPEYVGGESVGCAGLTAPARQNSGSAKSHRPVPPVHQQSAAPL